MNRARALADLGRTDEAVAAYEQSLARDPDDVVSRNNLGLLLVEQRLDVPRGVRLIEAALASAPEHPDFLDSLAVAYLAQGRLPETRALAERSLALDATSPSAPERRAHLEQIEAALRTQ